MCVRDTKTGTLQFSKWYIYTLNEQLSKNSSSEEIFSASNYEYETALNNSGYQETELIFNKKEERERKQKRNQSQNIIWSNPPFSRNVTTNVDKRFLNLLYIRNPKSNKLLIIFRINTVKVFTDAPKTY